MDCIMKYCGILGCLMTTKEAVDRLCSCYYCHMIKRKTKSLTDLASPSELEQGINLKITPRSSVYINVKKIETL